MEVGSDIQGKTGILGISSPWAICMTFDSVTILQKWSKKPLKFKKIVLKNEEMYLPAFWDTYPENSHGRESRIFGKYRGLNWKWEERGFYVVNQCQRSIAAFFPRWCAKTEREHCRNWDFRMLFLNVIASDRMKLIPGWPWF